MHVKLKPTVKLSHTSRIASSNNLLSDRMLLKKRKASCKVINLNSTTPSFPQHKNIIISNKGEKLILPIDQIRYIQASGNYACIHMLDNSSLFLAKTLKTLSLHIGCNDFIRIHQSYFINKNCIRKISSDQKVELCCGIRLPIARRRYTSVLEKMRNYCYSF